MKPAGRKAFEAAQADGRLEVAYDSQGKMEAPADFLELLKKDTKAFEFYKTLNRSNQYAIAWRLQTARRPETRAKRLQSILEMLGRGEKFH